MRIAPEGRTIVGVAAAAAVVFPVFLGIWSLLPFGLVFLFVAQFFREPHRKIPPVPEGGVLSPADGRVVFVAKGRIAGYRRYDAENQRLYECLQCSCQ